MTDAYIYDAIRTPRGKGRKDGSLHEVTAVRLSAEVLNETAKRNNLTDTSQIEDVIWGNVTQVGEQGACLARSAVLYSDLDESVPGVSVNRFCASGLEAVNMAANQVRGGAGNAYIAGGVESMSRVPMGMDGGAIAVDPYLAMKAYFVPQGISSDIIATKYGFTRDDCDAYAVESQKRAAAATKAGHFDKSRIMLKDQNGLDILGVDEQIRPTDMQGLGSLRPSFKDMGETMPGFDKVALMKYPELERINHVHHAGNSSAISDGAAAVLIGNKEFGEANGLKPRARFRSTAKIGTDPTIMLTGPVPVTEKILRDSGMNIGDIDLFEVNEAFASVVLRFMTHFNVDHGKLNVNGGAIAMGHPLGATGAMILGTLLDEMERSDKETGLATLCIGSGMGAATIIERV
ncbi:acetyl-CoA acetyltransferase [Amylibacter ulvae]|uniref:Acetyl-CoA acetyltransferase n=1 Tax=Paramylibacter ulvae TaxID=1651968 RepID=A0ABQ3D0K6_9RHOB|nr:acetyl-CoA C-acetyltransferase [Amylibacter ulvae]GHA51042.1 acetyl-CoA acetyltransferase [Amylibacter ulvae]